MAGPAPADAFRRLMSRWATGVSVVSASDGSTDAGLTVNAFLSVSLTPPTVLVSLSSDVDTLPVIERSGHFAVSLLAADQRPISERFARVDPSSVKFQGVPHHRAPHGSPILDGTIGALECEVVARTPVRDHYLVIGEVHFHEIGREAPPLLFFRSGYAVAEAPDQLRLPAGRP
jgi:3-hydroxy-9,10-secoandrosta-1,3,5(10)-triene-9,17-dione monooxygenase reductase component